MEGKRKCHISWQDEETTHLFQSQIAHMNFLSTTPYLNVLHFSEGTQHLEKTISKDLRSIAGQKFHTKKIGLILLNQSMPYCVLFVL